MEWRAQSRRVTLTSCMDDVRHAHNLSHAVWCAMSEGRIPQQRCTVEHTDGSMGA